MGEILKGAPVANTLTESLIKECKELYEKKITPTLAILRIGERQDDLSYERAVVKRMEKIGIDLRKFVFSVDAKKDEILEAVRKINEDDGIHGCLMFRPLPDRDTEESVCNLLSPLKDMDGMTAGSLAGVYSGNKVGFPPCTAAAVMELLRYYKIELTGKNVVVIGRSLVIGKPVSMMLQRENATVTMCHTRTVDLPKICRKADIIVAAAGRANMVTDEFVSKGQVVIDVGINVDKKGNLCGDVDFVKVEPIVSALTPVPGGVGSVTTAVLASHVIRAAYSK